MRKVNITIKGNSPLLINKYHQKEDGINPDTYEGLWKLALHLNKEGFLVMPQANLRACLQNGSKGLRNGKIYMSRVIQPSIVISPFEPLITFDGKSITIERIEKEGWVNISPVVVGRSRVPRERAEIPPGWEIEFSVSFKEGSKVTPKDLKQIVDNSGMVAGLGDWRASAPKPGPYGGFNLEKYTVSK